MLHETVEERRPRHHLDAPGEPFGQPFRLEELLLNEGTSGDGGNDDVVEGLHVPCLPVRARDGDRLARLEGHVRGGISARGPPPDHLVVSRGFLVGQATSSNN